MKKIIYLSIILGAISLNSCTNELETFNENPNRPSALSNPTTLLTGAEVGTINNSVGNLSRGFTIFTQHTNGNAFQSAEAGQYILTELDNEGDWGNIYQAGINANTIVQKFEATYPYYGGMARIILALNMGYATDAWGDIPFSDAFQGNEGNLTPKYDTQKNVIERIQSYLDIAIADLAKPLSANISVPGVDDIFYKGNTDKWTKLAYAIKARYAMRLTIKDGSTVAAQKALTYAQKSFTGTVKDVNSDNLVATFDGGNNQSSWYAFNNQRTGYIGMGKYFIDLLNTTADPRLPFYALADEHGNYVGAAPESPDADGVTSQIGDYIAGGPNTSLNIFTFSEIKFIEAEAQFRLGNTAAAQTALQAAVSASLINVTGADDTTFATSAAATVTLKNIITQKYIALFTSTEPYNDWRRTGFPVLTPNQNSSTKQIPVRLITPKSERTLNTNATVVSSFYTPVWWASGN
ncbi:SusD/RagB family nutrient-binding outer membrane lipoprotein [Flavobacterium sp. HJJ]|uniref:SusD/RagB family nutrient-binding outer membrane lipoprotein n=1 Tax=Flavobacterium sp. HJJ TaxID=2783792 RepID=UPI00188A08B8|nr:SusD/RagB family nutrient-binding outer membrane lipoprotein [Flavobacterium sp. HJJ]MBF4470209.1 SusD/RagB family nutrient-binding outer membrane lipoprotein [Flavobacterium sp. HJJ]